MEKKREKGLAAGSTSNEDGRPLKRRGESRAVQRNVGESERKKKMKMKKKKKKEKEKEKEKKKGKEEKAKDSKERGRGEKEREREKEWSNGGRVGVGCRAIEQGAMLERRCTNSVGRRSPHQPRSPG